MWVVTRNVLKNCLADVHHYIALDQLSRTKFARRHQSLLNAWECFSYKNQRLQPPNNFSSIISHDYRGSGKTFDLMGSCHKRCSKYCPALVSKVQMQADFLSVVGWQCLLILTIKTHEKVLLAHLPSLLGLTFEAHIWMVPNHAMNHA